MVYESPTLDNEDFTVENNLKELADKWNERTDKIPNNPEIHKLSKVSFSRPKTACEGIIRDIHAPSTYSKVNEELERLQNGSFIWVREQ